MKSFWLDERGSRGVREGGGDAAERSGGWRAAAAGHRGKGPSKGLNAKSGCRIASLIANAQLINNTKTNLISSPAFAFHAGGDDVREGSVW